TAVDRQRLAVAAELQARNGAARPRLGRSLALPGGSLALPGERRQQLAARRFPELDLAIAHGRQQPAFRRQSERAERTGPLAIDQLLPGPRVPETDRPPTAGECLAVGREGEFLGAGHAGDLLARRHFPQPGALVLAARGERPPVRRKDEVGHG